MEVLARGAAFLLGARAVGLAMGVGVYTLLTHGLSPHDFGVFTTALVIVQLATTPMDYALGPLTIREAIRHPAREVALVRRVGQLRLLVGVVVGAGLGLIAPALLGSANAGTLLVMLTVLPAGWFLAAHPVLQRRRALRALGWLVLLQGVVWLAAVALLAAAGAGLVWFAAGYVAAQIVFGVAVRRAARDALADDQARLEPVTMASFAGLVRSGAGLAMVAVLGVIYFKVDALLLFHLRGPVESAHYGLAFRILEQAAIIPITLHNVYLPRLLAATSGTIQLRQVFGEYLRAVLVVATPLVVIGMILAEPAVRTLFGDAYLESAELLPVVLVAFVPICAGYVVTGVALAVGATGRQLATAAAVLAANVGLNLWLVPRHGALAAAIVTVVSEVLAVTLLYRAVRRGAGLRLPWRWISRLGLALAAAAGVAAAVPSAVGRAAVFAGAYGVTVLATGAVSWREVRDGRLALAMANS